MKKAEERAFFNRAARTRTYTGRTDLRRDLMEITVDDDASTVLLTGAGVAPGDTGVDLGEVKYRAFVHLHPPEEYCPD